MKIELDFTPEMAAAVIEGRKCCTIRREKHGEAGDTFEVEGRTYRILQIDDTCMWFAVPDLYAAAGFDSPAELRDAYQKQYNIPKWEGDLVAFVHFFARVPEDERK